MNDFLARLRYPVNQLAGIVHVVKDIVRKTDIEVRFAFSKERNKITKHKTRAIEGKNLSDN